MIYVRVVNHLNEINYVRMVQHFHNMNLYGKGIYISEHSSNRVGKKEVDMPK